ncbi:hypothetical protein PROFUN_13638 [Planoprotostelium fungivorum]|uniref:Ribosome biogenesis protein WDR12 homolog n=1 Tax=Planoprotostelium fungivorum TaxID=1890364 RepID=A0A2P6MZX8_9EUKA|nr:hypothetical protein PROFUN_13638 [Planoprotostelium fungivorum]
MRMSGSERWNNIQSERFSAWINAQLSKRNLGIVDIQTDLCDGLMFIQLLEVVSGKSITRYTKNPKFISHKIDNISVALQFMETQMDIKTSGLYPNAIVEGNTRQILGMVWLIIQKCKSLGIEFEMADDPTGPKVYTGSSDEEDEELPPSPRTSNRSRPKSVYFSVNSGKLEENQFVKNDPMSPSKRHLFAPSEIAAQFKKDQIQVSSRPQTGYVTRQDVLQVRAKRTASALAAETASTTSHKEVSASPEKVPHKKSTGKIPGLFLSIISPSSREAKKKEEKRERNEPTTPRESPEEEKTEDSERTETSEEKTEESERTETSEEKTISSENVTPKEGEDDMQNFDATNVSTPREETVMHPVEKEEQVQEKHVEEKQEQKIEEKEEQKIEEGKKEEKEGSNTDDNPTSTYLDDKRETAQHFISKEEDVELTSIGREKVEESFEPAIEQREESTFRVEDVEIVEEERRETAPQEKEEEKRVEKEEEKEKTEELKEEEKRVEKEEEKEKTEELREEEKEEKSEGGQKEGRSEERQVETVKEEERGGIQEKTEEKREDGEEQQEKGEKEGEEKEEKAEVSPERKEESSGVSSTTTPTIEISPPPAATEIPPKTQDTVTPSTTSQTLAPVLDLRKIVTMQCIIRSFLRKLKMKNAARDRRRNEIAKEIRDSEAAYVNHLDVTVKFWLEPLRKSPDLCKASDVKIIFSQVEVIKNYNSLISQKVKERLSKWNNNVETKLGDIFLGLAEFLKVYTVYVNNYPKAFETMRECAKNSKFATFLEKTKFNVPECELLDLSSFLIKPIQRIPRYVLLLQELLQHTPPRHGDYNDIARALEKMKQVAGYVNDRKREAENLNQVFHVASNLTGKFDNLCAPHRRYIRRGYLTQMVEKTPKLRFCFLFNDILVCTKAKPKTTRWKRQSITNLLASANSPTSARQPANATVEEGDLGSLGLTFKYLFTIPLHLCQLHDLTEKVPTTEGFQFEISGAKKYIFRTTTNDEIHLTQMISWMDQIDDAVSQLFEQLISRQDDPKLKESGAAYSTDSRIDLNRPTFEGELHLRSSSWKRNFFVLKDQRLYLCRSKDDARAGKVKKVIPILCNCIAKLCILDREFSFQLGTSSCIYFLSAPSHTLLYQWMNLIRGVVTDQMNVLDVGTPKGTPNHSRSNSVVSYSSTTSSSEESIGDVLNRLRDNASNWHCADCGTKDPQWINITMGVLICTDCSGIHRRLGRAKIKSTQFGSWDVNALQSARNIDNRKANELYENDMPEYLKKPTERDSYATKNAWILEKYSGGSSSARRNSFKDMSQRPIMKDYEREGKLKRKMNQSEIECTLIITKQTMSIVSADNTTTQLEVAGASARELPGLEGWFQIHTKTDNYVLSAGSDLKMEGVDENETIEVRFITKLEPALTVTDKPFRVPLKLGRYGLSGVINHLLNSDSPRPFEFIVNDEFLRDTLEAFLKEKELSTEDLITIEYVEALKPPEHTATYEHPDWISSIAALATKRQLLSGSYDKVIRVWDMPTTKDSVLPTDSAVLTCTGHTDGITKITIFNEVDDVIGFVSASRDGSLRTWNVNVSDKQIINPHHCKGHSAAVQCVDVSPASLQLGKKFEGSLDFASGSWDKTHSSIMLWRVSPSGAGGSMKGEKRRKTTTEANGPRSKIVGHTNCVSDLTWYSEEEIASVSWDHTLRVWNVESGLQAQLKNLNTSINGVSYSGRHRMFLTAHVDAKIKSCDTRGDENQGPQFTSHKGPVSSVQWHPTRENYFVTSGLDQTVKVWDFRSSYPLYTIKEHKDKVLAAVWSVQNNEKDVSDILSGGADTQLRQHHVSTGRE